ncbi:MAG: hypothetical protein WC110_06465 [Bacteroidales bacterium]
MTKLAIGVLLIPVGLVSAIIGLTTDVIYGAALVSVGLVATMAGLLEIEIAAVWERIEG